MSENLDDNLYDAIPSDALIDIKIQGDYYVSLKSVFNTYLIEDESKSSIGKIVENITNNKITSMKEHRLYLMYLLIVQIETDAKAQGLTVKSAVPKPE
jgi:hypothetical protein